MLLYDVIIIGGGPAGLNAAVVLGRSNRKVLLFDTGEQRNRHSQGIHNYLTRDGVKPAEFLRSAKKEAISYGTRIIHTAITSANSITRKHFILKDQKGRKYQSRKLLIATGLRDRLPDIEGIEKYYGESIFHCPYCDAWEVNGKRLGVYAKGPVGFELALSLRTWSDKVVYFSAGRRFNDARKTSVLEQYRIPVYSSPIKKLSGKNGKLDTVILNDEEVVPCDAIFFATGYVPQSDLVEMLGCNLTKKKAVITNRYQQTNIPGLYVAGDASRDMHFVVMAAAEGAKAGVIINKELQNEERSRFLK